jgi:hypothetical protein
MCGEKWGQLLHVVHAADVPQPNILVKHRSLLKHLTVRRHAEHRGRKGGSEGGREGGGVGGREEGHSVRSRYTEVEWGSRSEWVMS